MADRFQEIRQRGFTGRQPIRESSATSEDNQFAHAHQTFQSELGQLGKLFGGRKEKPGNISGLVLILCILFIGGAYFSTTSEKSDIYEHVFTGLISVVTLILGYLFGSSDRS